jgi:N-acetylmuramoyl-L-alanine amidase
MAAPRLVADSALVDHLRPSPNFGARAAGKTIDMVLLHYTGMPAGRGLDTAERAIRWLETPAAQVSAHYVVAEDGRITQMVAEAARAWHAGRSYWRGETDINSVAIGIEIAHPGHAFDPAALPDAVAGEAVAPHPGYGPFAPAQIARVIALVADIVARNRLDPARVFAHSDVAPARKMDPGERFPWKEFFNQGFGTWVEPEPVSADSGLAYGDSGADVAAVQDLLGCVGFRIPPGGTFDETTQHAITAFQRHWRPERVDGRADRSTVATMRRLVAAFPPAGRA